MTPLMHEASTLLPVEVCDDRKIGNRSSIFIETVKSIQILITYALSKSNVISEECAFDEHPAWGVENEALVEGFFHCRGVIHDKRGDRWAFFGAETGGTFKFPYAGLRTCGVQHSEQRLQGFGMKAVIGIDEPEILPARDVNACVAGF